jgi:hypothetical protein
LIAATLVFLTPLGALLSLGVAVPLAALVLATRRERRARALLRLGEPGRGPTVRTATALVAVVGLLGLAAAQPVLRSTSTVEARTDAQALFVIDISRSMLASRSPGASTRLARAREDAVRLRDDLADIPAGVATMTDQILPNLFPVPDRGVFEQTVRQAVQAGNPPPAGDAVTATNLGALGAIGTQSFFPRSVRRRVAIVLTDGESRPFDLRTTARQLGHAPGVTPIFIHVWGGDERVFDPGGKAETAYHPDPSSASTLAALAQATGGKAFGEGQLGAAARAVRAALGRGPTRPQGLTVSTTALARYVALAALLPLLVLLTADGVAPGLRRLAAARRSSRERAQKVPGQSTEIGAIRGRPTSS